MSKKKVVPAVFVSEPVNKSMVVRAQCEFFDLVSQLEYVVNMVKSTNKPAHWCTLLYRTSRNLAADIRRISYSSDYLALPVSGPIDDSDLPFQLWVARV